MGRYIIGNDPGSSGKGLWIYDTVTKECFYGRCDLRTFLPPSMKSKKPSTKKKKIVNRLANKDITLVVRRYLRALDPYLRDCNAYLIERQDISTTQIKLIAASLYEEAKKAYPRVFVDFGRAQDYRKAWGITLTKDAFKHVKDPKKRRQIRKQMSYHGTRLIPASHRTQFEQIYDIPKDEVDAVDAGLLGSYYAANPTKYLELKQQREEEERIKAEKERAELERLVQEPLPEKFYTKAMFNVPVVFPPKHAGDFLKKKRITKQQRK